MGRVVILTFITVGLIFFEYKKRKDIKKSIVSLSLFGYLLMVGYSGFILTRVIAPLFFIHMLSVAVSYLALLYYLLKNRLYWQLFIVPIVTLSGYFLLNFIDGARYEK